jgi:hypothetical protein
VTRHPDREPVLVFRDAARRDKVFHQRGRHTDGDRTACGMQVEADAVELPRFVAEAAGCTACDACARFDQVYGEAGALLQRPVAQTT